MTAKEFEVLETPTYPAYGILINGLKIELESRLALRGSVSDPLGGVVRKGDLIIT